MRFELTIKRGTSIRYAELHTTYDAVASIGDIAREEGLLNEGEEIVGIVRLASDQEVER